MTASPRKRPRKKTVEDVTHTSEAKATEELAVQYIPPEVEIRPDEEQPRISFQSYIELAKPHRGLVASFQYEAKKSEKGLDERTEADWKADFEKQRTKVYQAFQ